MPDIWSSANLRRKLLNKLRRPPVGEDLLEPDGSTDATWDLLSEAQDYWVKRIAAEFPEALIQAPVALTTSDGGKTYNYPVDANGNAVVPLGYIELRDGLAGPLLYAGADWQNNDFVIEATKIRIPNNAARTFASGLYARYVPQETQISASIQPIIQPPSARVLIVTRAAIKWATQGGLRDPGPWLQEEEQEWKALEAALAAQYHRSSFYEKSATGITAWSGADLVRQAQNKVRKPGASWRENLELTLQPAQWYELLSEAQNYWIRKIAADFPEAVVGPPTLLSSPDGGKTFTFPVDADGNVELPLGRVELRDGLAGSLLYAGADYQDNDFVIEGTRIRMPNNTTRTFASGLYARYVPQSAPITPAREPTLLPVSARILIVLRAVIKWATESGLRDPAPWLAEEEQEWKAFATALEAQYHSGVTYERSAAAVVRWSSRDLVRQAQNRVRLQTKSRRDNIELNVSADQWYDLLTEAQDYWVRIIAATRPDALYGPPTLLTTADGGYTYTFGVDTATDLPIFPIGHVEVRASRNGRVLIPSADWGSGDFIMEGDRIRIPNGKWQTFGDGPYARFVTTPIEISQFREPVLKPLNARILIVLRACIIWANQSGLRDPGPWEREEEAQWISIANTLATQFHLAGAQAIDDGEGDDWWHYIDTGAGYGGGASGGGGGSGGSGGSGDIDGGAPGSGSTSTFDGGAP